MADRRDRLCIHLPQGVHGRPHARATRAAVTLLAAIPLIRLVVDLVRGLDYLLYHYLVDDAFYYFEIARHIPEFNSGVPTSGFHPLYAILIAPIHRGLPAEPAIALSLVLLVLCLAASVWIVYALMRDLWDAPTALVCAAFWASSGKLYSIAMMGVETIIALTFVLLVLHQYVRLLRGRYLEPVRSALALGLLTGIAFWARMDTPLILGPCVAHCILLFWRRGERRAAMVTIMTTVALPVVWMILIWVWTGSALPTSTAALHTLSGYAPGQWLPFWAGWPQVRAFLRGIAEFYVAGTSWLYVTVLGALVLCALPGLWRQIGERSPASRQRLWMTALTLIGMTLWGSYYVYYQGGLRFWYLAYISLISFTIFIPLLMATMSRWLPQLQATWVGLGLAALVTFTAYPGPVATQEYDKYHAALVASQILDGIDDGNRIAAFNTGIYDYVMEDDVLNLDGVVNPQSARALRSQAFPRYLQEQNVGYFIEHELELARALEQFGDDRRLRLERWIDLSQHYPRYQGEPGRAVYLWRVKVLQID